MINSLIIGTTSSTISRIGMAAAADQLHPGHRWMLEALKFAQNALDKQEVPSKKSNDIIDANIYVHIF